MKKITIEEYQKLHFLIGMVSELSNNILNLADGEMLFISKEEWKLKTSPGRLISTAKYHPRGALKGIKLWTRTTEEGWVIGKGEKK